MPSHTVLTTLVPSSFHGWGNIALNLMLHWTQRWNLSLRSIHRVPPGQIDVDPIDAGYLAPLLEGGPDIEKLRLMQDRGRVDLSCPLVVPLGNQMVTMDAEAGLVLGGRPNLGITFFERTNLTAEALDRARNCEILVAGSTWNRELLVAQGIGHAETVIQGIDPTLFHPAPVNGMWGDRFVVFSGGKLEVRKAQDLVVRAFAIFARRHPDALLLTTWSSFWPDLARKFDLWPAVEPVPVGDDGTIDLAGWTRRNGVPDAQVWHLGLVPNNRMPRILREASVGLFPNRAEGGTNLVAMECMACGVPTILSANTGHLDIIREDACYPLERQAIMEGHGADGWGESDVDEIVDALERVYADRATARRRAAAGAGFMAGLTWRRYAGELAGRLLPWLAGSPAAG